MSASVLTAPGALRELNTGMKYSVKAEYPNIIAQLNKARSEGRMVKLELLVGGGDVHVNPEYVVSVEPMPY